jgi:hypothetical protein
MANTKVSHITLTVTTVKVFIETMRYISEHDLWGDAERYLKEHGKTEMFFDYEVLDLYRDMLKQHSVFDPENRTVDTLLKHLPGIHDDCESAS